MVGMIDITMTVLFRGHTSIPKTKCKLALHQRKCENGIVVGTLLRICTWHLFIADLRRRLHLLAGSSTHCASGLEILASLSPTFRSFDRMFSCRVEQPRHNVRCVALFVPCSHHSPLSE